jgi:hypothetical protein
MLCILLVQHSFQYLVFYVVESLRLIPITPRKQALLLPPGSLHSNRVDGTKSKHLIFLPSIHLQRRYRHPEPVKVGLQVLYNVDESPATSHDDPLRLMMDRQRSIEALENDAKGVLALRLHA